MPADWACCSSHPLCTRQKPCQHPSNSLLHSFPDVDIHGQVELLLNKGLLVPLRTRCTLTTAADHCLVLPCSFYGQLELLLDESVLVGRGRLCQEALRPLAFSMLAELVHHVRSDLTLKQLSRIIYMFSR